MQQQPGPSRIIIPIPPLLPTVDTPLPQFIYQITPLILNPNFDPHSPNALPLLQRLVEKRNSLNTTQQRCTLYYSLKNNILDSSLEARQAWQRMPFLDPIFPSQASFKQRLPHFLTCHYLFHAVIFLLIITSLCVSFKYPRNP